MFTLDETTLFYFSISQSMSSGQTNFSKKAGIMSWASKVNSGAFSRAPSATNSIDSRRTSATLPATTTGSSHSNTTAVKPASDAALGRATSGPSNQDADTLDADTLGMDVTFGAMSDEEEMKGTERDAAVNSPPKGKKRLTSSVSAFELRLGYL